MAAAAAEAVAVAVALMEANTSSTTKTLVAVLRLILPCYSLVTSCKQDDDCAKTEEICENTTAQHYEQLGQVAATCSSCGCRLSNFSLSCHTIG